MNRITSFGKALSDPTRVRILGALLAESLCVCELADALELTQSTLSTHLQTLRACGMVTTERRGTWVIYSIAPEVGGTLVAIFEEFAAGCERLESDRAKLASRIRVRIEGCCPPESASPEARREAALR